MHLAAVFREINGLFTGGITAPQHRQLLLAELGGGTVTDGAGTDAFVPIVLFPGDL